VSKFLKITLFVFGGFSILLISLWLLLQTLWFQDRIKNFVTHQLSKGLETEVKIDRIKIIFFNRFEAKNVLIRDQIGDTLIFTGELDSRFKWKELTSKELVVQTAELSDVFVNFGMYENAEVSNFKFFIDYFKTPKKKDSDGPKPLVFDEIKLNNCRFYYFNKNYDPPPTRDFNENDIQISAINGKLKKFQIIGDSIDISIQDLSAHEQCGLNIKEMHTQFAISSQIMKFDQLYLRTNHSFLSDYVSFSYHNYSSFSHFLDSVNFDANFTDSKITTSDLAYFDHTLKKYNEAITINGSGTGVVNDFKTNSLTELSISPYLILRGNVAITNVVDWQNMYLNINANTLKLNTKNLKRLDSGIPNDFIDFNFIEYAGIFKGTINDFHLIGKGNTGYGKFETNLFFNGKTKNEETYKGVLAFEHFQIGKLLKFEQVESLTTKIFFDGKGLSLPYLDSKVEGNIESITYLEKNYKNISIDGIVQQRLFSGKIGLDNEYALGFIDGIIDFKTDIPKYDITADIKRIDLYKLQYDTIPSTISFSGNIKAKGTEVNNFFGDISLKSVEWKRNETTYNLDEVFILASDNENIKNYNINIPEYLTIKMQGDMIVTEVPFFLQNIAHKLYPTSFDTLYQELTSNNVKIDLNIPKFHPFIAAFYPNLKFKSAGLIFDYQVSENIIHSNGKIFNFYYDKTGLGDIQFTTDTDTSKNLLSFWVSSNYLSYTDSVITTNLIASGLVNDGILNFDFSTNKDTSINVNLSAKAGYMNDSLILNLTNFELLVEGEVWDLMPTDFPNVVVRQGVVELFHFDFRHDEQILFFDGTFGKEKDKINITLDSFHLKTANPFLTAFGVKLDGRTNGYIDLSYRKGFPIWESDFQINDFALNNDTLGKLSIKTNTGKKPLILDVMAQVESEFNNTIKIGGFIDFEEQKNPLHLTLKSINTELHYFEKYTEGLASDLYGKASADVKIFGTFNKPKLKGEIDLDSVSFVIDYIGTKYKTNTKLIVDNNKIVIKKSPIYDVNGNKGLADGNITHDLFTNFVFDIRIDDLKNFQCLNTTRKDNELFYGTAYADGRIKVSGPLENIKLMINAKSKRGTQIKIPLDNAESDGTLNYIQFVNLKEDNYFVKDVKKISSGITMDFNFEVTQEAEVQLIFDEVLGDVIKGQAEGNIRMEINTFGDFNMYGLVTIARGEYLFTALDVLTKKFTLESGGTISWDGDPYNARLNLKAVKRENPRPSGLMVGLVSEDIMQQYQSPIAVDCILGLRGALFQPEISFDIEFPTVSTLTGANYNMFNAVVERIRSDKEELDRQVFALLALGTFIPPGFATETAGDFGGTGLQSSVNNSIGDLISSQVSNLLTQIDPRWQVGINYQAPSDLQGTELALSLRRQFFNNRFEFSGSYDAINNNTGTRPYNLNLQYNINQSGNLKVSGFQRNANDPSLGNIANVTTTGVGLFFRYEFDEWKRYKNRQKIRLEDEIQLEDAESEND